MEISYLKKIHQKQHFSLMFQLLFLKKILLTKMVTLKQFTFTSISSFLQESKKEISVFHMSVLKCAK